MLWIAVFDNKPDMNHVRLAQMEAHIAYLQAHPEIVMAGSTHARDEEAANGGAWIIKTDSYDKAVRLCENDPFFIAGRRAGYRLCDYRVAPHHKHLF